METYEKKGYLYSDFRLFYLTDTASKEFEYTIMTLIRSQFF